MILLALWFVLPPLFAHAESRKGDEMRAANVLVYQDQRQELDTDLRNGLIGEPEYQKEQQELERRLLADTETAKRASSASPATSSSTRKLAYTVTAAQLLFIWFGAIRKRLIRRLRRAHSLRPQLNPVK